VCVDIPRAIWIVIEFIHTLPLVPLAVYFVPWRSLGEIVLILKGAFNKVDYPPLCYLRHQTPNAFSHVRNLPHHPFDLWTNRTRLPELNQEAIKVQPLPKVCFLNDSPDVAAAVEEDHAARDTNCDLSKISVFGCDGLECFDGPSDVP
jgi:hypothetical protein